MPMQDLIKWFFGWLLCHALGEFLQTTSDRAFKNYSNECIFELGERNPVGSENICNSWLWLAPPPKRPWFIQFLVGSFSLLLHSIEPRHLTNQSHPRVPLANGFLLIVEYRIHHIINIHDDDDVIEQKHDLSGGDAREQSNRCALPWRSSVLGGGSWHPFWFDHIFCSMIFWPCNGQHPSWWREP